MTPEFTVAEDAQDFSFMRNFAEQSLDIARHIFGHWLGRLGKSGAAAMEMGYPTRPEEAGHLAHALASYVALAGQRSIPQGDLVDAAARCIASQFYYAPESSDGCVHAAMALMTLGLNRSKNAVWEQFPGEIQALISRWMRRPLAVGPSERVFSIAQGVVAAGMGFADKDDSDKQIEQHINEILRGPGAGFVSTAADPSGGRYDGSGLGQLLFLREVIQRHANVHVRERRLPALRSCFQKYLRLLPLLAQGDASCWAYGSPMGCLGTVYGCTAIICSLADGWVEVAQRAQCMDLLGRFSRNFFFQYVDQEEGILRLRDSERDIPEDESETQTCFDVARQLVLWGLFGRQVEEIFPKVEDLPLPTGGRFLPFSPGGRREQGLLLHRDAASGIAIQLPLCDGVGTPSCAHLAYPHCSGIFEAPSSGYLPILLPELAVNGHVLTPSFHGKNIGTGLGRGNEFQWSYEQPELVTVGGNMVSGLASCKVRWSFQGTKVRSEFVYSPKKVLRLDGFRYMVAIPVPHSKAILRGIPILGEGGPNPEILQDDFQGEWQPLRDVGENPAMRTHTGKIRYLLSYVRLLPLQMQTGRDYRFSVSLTPDIVRL
ncbi:MAG: hypothetical protein LBS68_02470 [Puniceicoccales bacterium]|nr:hypothetical protein [Puniceicoccales bacterium]